jgi:hypothetical protein
VLVTVKSPLFVPLTARPVMLRGAVPLLLRVKGILPLAIPTGWFPKLVLVGARVATGTPPPVPERLTVCGLPVALSVIVSAPTIVPVAVGVKVTLIVQLAPAANPVPQVFVCANGALATMEVNVTEPLLVSVTVWAGLVEPTD